MGRLMDSVMAALGLKPSDRVILTYEPPLANQETPPSSSENSSSDLDTQSDDDSNSDKDIEEYRARIKARIQLKDTGRSFSSAFPGIHQMNTPYVKKTENKEINVVPPAKDPLSEAEIAEKYFDCVSCRVIGSSLLFGSAGWVTFLTKTYAVKHVGIRQKALIGQGIVLTSMLCVLGVMRAGSMGIFDPAKRESSLFDLAKDELSSFAKVLGIAKVTTEGIEKIDDDPT